MLDILGSVTGLVGKVLDTVLPSDMDKAQKNMILAQAEALTVQNALAEESAFRTFMLDYEGRASDINPTMAAFRASVRPVVTYATYATIMWCVFAGHEVPQIMNILGVLVTGFWFGERAFKGAAPLIKEIIGARSKE